MWLNLLSLGVKTGAKLYQNKQRTKELMSNAQMRHAEQMAKGEIEYILFSLTTLTFVIN